MCYVYFLIVLLPSLSQVEEVLLRTPVLQMCIMFDMANRRQVPLDRDRLRRIFNERNSDSTARMDAIFRETSKVSSREPASTRIPKMQEYMRQKERLVNHDYIVFLARRYFIELYPEFSPPYPITFRSIFGTSNLKLNPK